MPDDGIATPPQHRSLALMTPATLDPREKPFQPLNENLLASAFRLSSLAGWNQTIGDWQRLVRIDPAGTGVWVDKGEVRASYSVSTYGREAAWIGMILVDPSCRGVGLGKAAFQAALDRARESACRVLGLDATDLGEPIYVKKGFEAICPVARWGGVLGGDADTPNDPVQTGLHRGILDLDTRCSGMDRSALLGDLAATDGTLISRIREGKTTGYAVIRPGRTAFHLGPVVACTDEDLNLLLNEVSTRLQGREMICDVLSEATGSILRRRGLTPLRHLKRMTLPASPGCLCGPELRCATGFEWG